MAWRLAESLKKLREQVNAAYPNRDKSSDGAIGDAAHASRSSDHNPWVKDSKGQGVVTAIDIDEDLSPSNTVMPMIQSIIASRDPRVKYIIYEGKMCSSYPAQGFKAWTWRPYSGKNPHRHHAHISVNPSPYHYDNRAEWNIGSSVKFTEPVVLEIPAAAAQVETVTAGPSPEPVSVEQHSTPGTVEQPPHIFESLDKYGDKFQNASATADKFGIPRDTINQSVWSILQSFGLKIGGGVTLWFAHLAENPVPWVIAGLSLIGMGVFAWKWSRERKRNAEKKS